MFQEISKIDGEVLGKAAKEWRTVGRGEPPVATLMKLQQSPTKANLPRPFSYSQRMIPTVH